MFYIGIIGTAGRGAEYKLFTKENYSLLVNSFHECFKSLANTKEVRLFSGGAAFIDHIAVKLFLTGEYEGLELFLPSEFDRENNKYKGFIQSGARSNELHYLMELQTKNASLKQIGDAINKGAIVHQYDDFFKRNNALALYANRNNATVYASTFGTENIPKDGGTKYTWNRLTCTKFHISLNHFLNKS